MKRAMLAVPNDELVERVLPAYSALPAIQPVKAWWQASLYRNARGHQRHLVHSSGRASVENAAEELPRPEERLLLQPILGIAY